MKYLPPRASSRKYNHTWHALISRMRNRFHLINQHAHENLLILDDIHDVPEQFRD